MKTTYNLEFAVWVYENLDSLVEIAKEEFSDVTNTDELVTIFGRALDLLVGSDEGKRRRVREIFKARLEESRDPVSFLSTTPIASWEDHYVEQRMNQLSQEKTA